jgi:hypothetical protein
MLTGGGTGGGGKGTGFPVVALPLVPVVPAMATLMTWLVHVSAVHVYVLVVLVTRRPLGLWGVVFVVVEEEEMLQPGPAAHDGRAPALTRSICASLSRSAAHALPTLRDIRIRQAGSNVLMHPSKKCALRRSRHH